MKILGIRVLVAGLTLTMATTLACMLNLRGMKAPHHSNETMLGMRYPRLVLRAKIMKRC